MDSWKVENNLVSIYFRSTNIKDGKQTNQLITKINKTNNFWFVLSVIFITQLTADSLVLSEGKFDGAKLSRFMIQKIK